MLTERKLLWYMHSENDPEIHTYNFLIINKPREISMIKQNLRVALKPVIEETSIASGVVTNSGGLNYDLFSMASPVCEVDWSEVYQGRVKEDRRLVPRKTCDGWNVLINSTASGSV
ncbi:MAG: hypothetical protein ABIG30_00035 [Candidatus Aenigmatarchaeota archaeon]